MKGRGRARGKKGEKCMASSQTANYKLNQWAASDQFLRTEFNADNSRIDAALANITKLTGAKAALTFGSYTGNGALTRTITLSFTPKAVFLITNSGTTAKNLVTFGGLALSGKPVTADKFTLLQIVTGGFQVGRGGSSSSYYSADANNENTVYYYIAVS